MKKALVAAILGLTTAAVVNAQSYVKLDTYNSSPYYQAVTYGPGAGGSGAIADGAFTFGFYYAAGDQTGAINASMTTGFAIPGAGALLATGANSTTPSTLSGFANIATGSWLYDNAATDNQTITVVVVAYNGADYASSAIRGHSQAFTYTAVYAGNGGPGPLNGFQTFQVVPVPEPSTFALAGLGLAGLLIFRRRK